MIQTNLKLYLDKYKNQNFKIFKNLSKINYEQIIKKFDNLKFTKLISESYFYHYRNYFTLNAIK